MALNDSLSDMLARIKNAHQANKVSTLCLKSKLNMNVLSVLKDEGYIRDFKNIEERKGINSIKIDLKYYNGTPVINCNDGTWNIQGCNENVCTIPENYNGYNIENINGTTVSELGNVTCQEHYSGVANVNCYNDGGVFEFIGCNI